MTTNTLRASVACVILTLAVAPAALAQTTSKVQQVPPSAGGDIPKTFTPIRNGFDYVKRDVMIPMRDGVKLHTVIVIPKGVAHGPMMLDRTPYSASKLTERGEGGPLLGQILFPAYAELAEHGYIIVVQDVRGKYGSQGKYVMNRPVRGALNVTRTDNATDAYDTIAWLVKNVHDSNGRVGTIGTSYDGFTTLMSLIDPNPALKAAVPMNPMVDVWMGDDWFHHGAFRQEMMSYVYGQTAKKDSGEHWFSLRYDDYDTFMHYVSAGAFGAAMGMQQLPFWQRLSHNPAYDDFWQDQAVDRILAKAPLTVPTLLVDSQWDQEDIYGAPAVWRALKGKPGDDKLHLVLGPWYHGEENARASTLGVLDWGSDTGKWFRQNVMIPFLDAHLKDAAPTAHIARVTAYVTGTDNWVQLPDWPVAKATTPLYFGAGGTLALYHMPASGAAYDEYVSDPAKPVTYRERPNRAPYVKGSSWRTWLVDDQRFAAARPDVLVYTSAPLAKPLHIAGRPLVDLFASTSGTDSDWVVKLIDVYPDIVPEKPEMGGYQLAVSMDILRGRSRDDPARPTAIPAGKVVEYKLPLTDIDHVFLPGHRLMVQVQSSWFPLYDRNPQTFVQNIFFAKPSDYHTATQRIYHAPGMASAVLLPEQK
ncbi:CocE/NonD family hydrolase [Lichenicoccus sp.]|uniref:CocE/NonD family hydrolase n=1 Tax=Lichenicoccus sp. TaxID=2781899 RepID=UPI003D0DD4DC